MSSISSLSSASGLSVLTMAQATSQGDLSNLRSDARQLVQSAQISFVSTASQSGVQTSVINTMTAGKSVSGGEALVASLAQQVTQNNNMTSAQISSLLYAGGGLQTATGETKTFADLVSGWKNVSSNVAAGAADMAAWQAAGRPENPEFQNIRNMSSDEVNSTIQSLLASSKSMSDNANQLDSAFKDGTITIQKATDVQGLDYQETDWVTATGTGMAAGANITMNQKFLDTNADGKNHSLVSLGGVELYLSW